MDSGAVRVVKGASETNHTNYRFDGAGEERLSAWMREHLRVRVRALELEDPQPREAELIAVACPPRNLTSWANGGALPRATGPTHPKVRELVDRRLAALEQLRGS